MQFEMYVDKAGEWRWRLRADNDVDVLADSGEGYKRLADCEHAISLVKSSDAARVITLPRIPPLPQTS